MVGIDAAVAVQVGIADARQQQGAQPRVIAKAILLALPFQGDHPLPAAVELAVPFRADGEQAAEAVGIGQLLVLVAASDTQLVGHRWVAGNVIPQADVLPWRRQLHFRAIAVALRVGPVPLPLDAPTRADIGGEPKAQAHGARQTGLQVHIDGNHLLLGHRRAGIDPHRFEVTARAQRLVELGDALRVIGRIRRERHHALQQFVIERHVAFETDVAQAVARAAVIDQFDIGQAGLGIDTQALLGKAPVEETIARRLVLDMPFGRLVAAMIEPRTLGELGILGQLESAHLRRRSIDPHGHVAKAHRLAGNDPHAQARWLLLDHLSADLRVVIAQRLGGFLGLALDHAAQALQRLDVTLA
ncbi:hypothetical protein SRABI70_03957 [Pseudomonas sp. Bi70]|nr:hypothetical protein SRABI70_03957 [Pseudomonas sp. Bi70]